MTPRPVRRKPYAIRNLGNIKGFGSEESAHRIGGDGRLDESRVFVYTKGKEVLLVASGMEVLTPDRAVSVARRLLNAAEYASNTHDDEVR